tara:strand:- start:128 stop:445 length:318 start_codon:yes stop_codon:yes gene_type:complete
LRNPGVQSPPKHGKLLHWVIVWVIGGYLVDWHARRIHTSLKEATVEGGMERWWHPEGSNLTDPAVQARASRDANNANRALGLVTTSGSDTPDFLGEAVASYMCCI